MGKSMRVQSEERGWKGGRWASPISKRGKPREQFLGIRREQPARLIQEQSEPLLQCLRLVDD